MVKKYMIILVIKMGYAYGFLKKIACKVFKPNLLVTETLRKIKTIFE